MQRVSTQLLTLILLHVLLLGLDGGFFYHQMAATRHDARIINYVGMIRGSMQRLSKLEALGASGDEIAQEINSLLQEFTQGDAEFVLGMDEKLFDDRLSDLGVVWIDLRAALHAYRAHPGPKERQELLRISEKAWMIADQTVFAAQTISESKWERNMLAVGLLLLNVPLLAATYWIVRKIVRDRLEYDVAHDMLTGAYSRLTLGAMIKGLVRSARRHDRPLSYLVMDLDHFKSINDRYGHAAGDAVLKNVVQALHGVLRASDLLFRVGGEEFVAVLPETKLEQAGAVAEKIRRQVLPMRQECGAIVTVSIGVTEFRMGDDGDSLFSRADALLFEAKTGGRNCYRMG